MSAEIKKITIVSGQGIKSHEVGVDGVIRIEDRSAEFEHEMFISFLVYGKKREKLFEIINCPVEVSYFSNQ